MLAELRRVAEELVTDDDVAEFRPFGWDEEWARARAADQHHRQLVQEWERQHRTPLTVPARIRAWSKAWTTSARAPSWSATVPKRRCWVSVLVDVVHRFDGAVIGHPSELVRDGREVAEDWLRCGWPATGHGLVELLTSRA